MVNRKRKRTFLCSFCGKSMDQVQRLIAGPGGVYVCDECISGFSSDHALEQIESRTAVNAKQLRETTRCSFCGKNQKHVQHLHKGPGDVRICNECIDLCCEIIEEEQQRR